MFKRAEQPIQSRAHAQPARDGRLSRSALGALAVTLLLWSSTFAGIRSALRAYGPAELALLRWSIASAFLAIYALFAGMRLPALRDWPMIFLAGVLGVTVYHVALNNGEVTVSAGATSFLVATTPVFTAILAWLLLGEHLGGRGWAGIIVSFAGIGLIASTRAGGLHFEVRALCVLLSAVCSSFCLIIQKRLLKRYTALEVAASVVWAGTALLLVFAPGLAAQFRAAPLRATLVVAYLGILPAGLASITWAYAIARLPASRAASTLYLTPAAALVVAWVWLGESPPAMALAGGALAIGGVALVNTRRVKVRRAAADDGADKLTLDLQAGAAAAGGPGD